MSPDRLESASDEADKLDLIDPEALRRALDATRGQRGLATLRRLLDRRAFTLTESALERRFLRLARRGWASAPADGPAGERVL